MGGNDVSRFILYFENVKDTEGREVIGHPAKTLLLRT